MPSLTLLPTSHMPTPQLSTTPSTPDSSTPLLSPTSMMPQVKCAWKQGHAVTLVHQKNETSFLEDVVVVKKIFVMVVENDDQVCDNFEGWKVKVMRVFHRWCCWWCFSCRWGLCAWRHRYKMIGKHERQMMKMTKRGHPRSFLSHGSSSSIFAVAALVVIVGLDTCTL